MSPERDVSVEFLKCNVQLRTWNIISPPCTVLGDSYHKTYTTKANCIVRHKRKMRNYLLVIWMNGPLNVSVFESHTLWIDGSRHTCTHKSSNQIRTIGTCSDTALTRFSLSVEYWMRLMQPCSRYSRSKCQMLHEPCWDWSVFLQMLLALGLSTNWDCNRMSQVFWLQPTCSFTRNSPLSTLPLAASS